MSSLISSSDANYFPSGKQRYHDLVMMYLEKTFDFSNKSPKELLEKYKEVYSEIASSDTKPKL